MAISVFTLIERSVKNMGAVNPKVKDLAVELIKRAYHEGIYAQISSGYRSNAEQTKLYNQGRTTPGNIVTNARAGQSIHNYGLAIDYFLVTPDGNTSIWTVNSDWRRVAAIGKQLGFQWGGDWKSFRDYPHLDMQRGMSLSQLASGKRPAIPNVPKRSYLGAGDTGAAVKAAQQNLTLVGFKTTADGEYGEGTANAVKQFQKSRGITADGFYGAGTLSEMNKALKGNPAPSKPATPKPTPAPQKPAEPKEDDQLDLSQRQREEIAQGFKEARERGVFSSDEHEKAILDGSMTVSRLVYLNHVIAVAGLMGGERLIR